MAINPMMTAAWNQGANPNVSAGQASRAGLSLDHSGGGGYSTAPAGRTVTYDPNASPAAGNWAPSANNATSFAAKSGPSTAGAPDIARFMRTDGVVPAGFGSVGGYSPPAAPRAPSLEGPMPDGSTLSEHVRKGGSPLVGQIGGPAFDRSQMAHLPSQQQPQRPDPWAFLGDAMKGYQSNVETLKGLNNPWESTMSLGALDRSRAGVAAQGARAGVHNQNDAIKQMMAGGGLMAQGDLNNMSDNMRAGVTNAQNNLYADYNKQRIGWEDQRQQNLASQYDRMAGLAEAPLRFDTIGLDNEGKRYGNQVAAQQAYEYTKQDAANFRAGLQELGYKDAALDWQKKNQDVYEYTKPESAGWRQAERMNGAEQGQAQVDEIRQRMLAAQRAGDTATAQQLGTLGARIAKAGGFKWLGGAIGGVIGSIGPQALLGGTAGGLAGGAWLGDMADKALGG